MTDRTADDEARWAEAQSLLDRRPTESAAQRLRRSRRNRWLLIAALVLVGLAAAVLLALFVLDDGTDRRRTEDVPTWQVVTGFAISGLGLLFMVVALVVQFRGLRRVRAWGSPLHVLTLRQRKELLRQVRGRGPDVPERVPLARHLAEVLLAQRLGLPVQAGLLVNFAGLWIVDRETVRLVLVAVFAVLLVVGGVLVQCESRRARRYLVEVPEPAP